MNEKNSLGLNLCFKDHNNPIKLFEEWFNKAKKTEINDPNAFAVGTVNKKGFPTVRMVLLKDFDKNGFVFYTNLKSDKSKAIKNSSKISMCFHWKSLQRQIRVIGIASKVSKKEADDYYKSRAYGSRIGAWASQQSSILKKREDLYKSIKEFKKNEIVSFGITNKSGRPHAESIAIDKTKFIDNKYYTLYSTLEPCCHQGRGESCVKKINETIIKRVVYSLKDPDRRVNGKGEKILKKTLTLTTSNI